MESGHNRADIGFVYKWAGQGISQMHVIRLYIKLYSRTKQVTHLDILYHGCTASTCEFIRVVRGQYHVCNLLIHSAPAVSDQSGLSIILIL